MITEIATEGFAGMQMWEIAC